MNEIENLLEQLLSKMTDVASSLEVISGKLDNLNGSYNLDDLVEKLDEVTDNTEIASSLEEISGKLDNLNGAYGLDDVVAKLDEVTDNIVGATRYNLTDLHGELSNITFELSSINTTSMMTEIASSLEEISGKLDNLNGAYSLDDVVAKFDEATDNLVGAARYNLTDLYGELTNITTELSSINTTLELKD
ncbi:MAG: hypothetical protein AB1717_05170 [Pseudomonadota bacterium]